MRYFFFIFLLPAFLVFGGFASAQTVPAPSLSITAPVAGTQLSAGTPVNVAWSLSNAPQGAEVRYLAQFPKDNQGGVISRIVTTPSYTWAIPTTLPSASYTILVKALVRADGKARIYQGEKVVQVQGSVAGQNTAMGSGSGITPSLSITAPVAGTQLSAGTPVNVAWSLSNAPQGAEVRYLAQFPKDN
ncbi:MAG: Ig-like domain-containing protein, partial [bacterium]|nr:Ig-like domain-containing protein [bacterium]